MREVAPRIRPSPVSAVVAGSARVLGGAADDIEPSCTLRQAQSWVEELVDADRCKDGFLAMLGHELRNPLGAIKNSVGFLQSEPGQTYAQRRALAIIDRQVRRMTRLVDDLLDVSRIPHRHLRLRGERMDLRTSLSNAVETVESEANDRRQQLSIAVPAEPVWLRADPERLEQIFVNLLANASRYTDAGGEIAVSVHLSDGHAVVCVRDTGIGIAQETLPYVFDLYRQVDEANPRSRAGLGIGLALVRQLVQLHGGNVSAASAGLGQGSEFTVSLPREDEAAGDRFPET